MSGDVFKVMYYDLSEQGGLRRLYANGPKIRQAAQGIFDLDLDMIHRHKKFNSENGAEELLMDQPEFPYGAVIINELAQHAKDVIAAAELGCKQHGIPLDRIVCLTTGISPDGATKDMRYVKVSSGDGYLNDKDTQKLIQVLSQIYEETPRTS